MGPLTVQNFSKWAVGRNRALSFTGRKKKEGFLYPTPSRLLFPNGQCLLNCEQIPPCFQVEWPGTFMAMWYAKFHIHQCGISIPEVREVTNSEPIANGPEWVEVNLAFSRQVPGQPSGMAAWSKRQTRLIETDTFLNIGVTFRKSTLAQTNRISSQGHEERAISFLSYGNI